MPNPGEGGGEVGVGTEAAGAEGDVTGSSFGFDTAMAAAAAAAAMAAAAKVGVVFDVDRGVVFKEDKLPGLGEFNPHSGEDSPLDRMLPDKEGELPLLLLVSSQNFQPPERRALFAGDMARRLAGDIK